MTDLGAVFLEVNKAVCEEVVGMRMNEEGKLVSEARFPVQTPFLTSAPAELDSSRDWS